MAVTISGSTPTFSAATGYTGGTITSGTAVSASGTSVDFTSIPSWAKRITVMFAGVSTSGISPIGIQLGTSSGFVTTGYSGSASGGGTGVGSTSSSSCMNLQYTANSSAYLVSGAVYIVNLSGNTWVEFGSLGTATTPLFNTSGNSITLSGVLDRVRVTIVNGTDTFDAGTINIFYE